MNTAELLKFFPFSEARPNQIKAIEWLAQQDKKYLLLEAPVGSGKSALALWFSRFLNNRANRASYILTPQKILQTQYERSFTEIPQALVSLYGKNNYSCAGKNTTCDIGSLIKPRCENCPAKAALLAARDGGNVVLNYKLALLLFAFTDVFDKQYRSLMVLDECHTIEDHLTELGAVLIHSKRAQKLGITDWPRTRDLVLLDALQWTHETYLPAAEKYLSHLFHQVEPLREKGATETLTRSEIKLLREYSKLESHIDDVTELCYQQRDAVEREYVLVFDKDQFKFKQITGAKNFKRFLDPRARRFLFMSSTILNKEGFCKDLGLSPEETAFLSLDSDFPIENRQVFYIPQMKMNASWNDQNRLSERKKTIEGLKKILELHSTENGIIHTGNFKIAEWLSNELNLWPQNKHEIMHHNPSSDFDRSDVIHEFQELDRPAILISPSITEGLDLVNNKARFAIFAKVPFGFLGDQWIKRRMQMSKEWYQRRALIDIIQGGGRIVRSKEDWGTVYILDESWGFLYNVAGYQIPKWWKEAYNAV